MTQGSGFRLLTAVLVLADDGPTRAVELLADWEPDQAADLIVVLCGSSQEEVQALSARLSAGPASAARVMSCAQISLPAAVDVALDQVMTPWTMVWPGYAEPEPGWLPPLIEAARNADPLDRILQPLVLMGDGTVSSAGARWWRTSPTPDPHLRSWPVEDARREGDLLVAAPLSPVVAVRTGELLAMGGLSAAYEGGLAEVDLGVRLSPGPHDRTRVVVASAVTGRGPARFGFPGGRAASQARLAAYHGVWIADRAGVSPVPVAPRGNPELGGGDPRRPSLRWALDTAAPGGARGRRWGDWAFAQALAAALTRAGQVVSVDTKASRGRPTRRVEEVVLVLRGLDRCTPVPGAVNVLWVISHPDDVTADECAGFDLVFAASADWAARKSHEWGRLVLPLLQCTDPAIFHPAAGHGAAREGTAFVGNTRGGVRELVLAAVAAGLEPAIHGQGWDGLVDPALVHSEHLSSEQVAAVYASSEAVLCDHWDDMRREGFISNRVFDVLACATPLVCDRVDGVRDLAPGLVTTTGPDDDWAILRDGVAGKRTCPEGEAQALAALVAQHHSFDARAGALVDAVLHHLVGTSGSGNGNVEV